MSRNIYGPKRVISRSDWALFTNEQLGFTSALSAAQTSRLIALTFPSGFNLQNQTITTSKLEFDQHNANPIIGDSQMLAVYMSMLQQDFSPTFNTLADVDDENMRAQFAGPIMFGLQEAITTIAADDIYSVDGPGQKGADWYPEVPRVDQLTPFYIQFVNASRAAVSAAGSLPTRTDYIGASVEATTLREWFNVRNLTKAERDMRGNQLQWLRLNS